MKTKTSGGGGGGVKEKIKLIFGEVVNSKSPQIWRELQFTITLAAAAAQPVKLL